jgi:glycosyltransferase involved in cell wall biosynthesis
VPPDVTVVMTAYNRAGLIGRAVASLVEGGGDGMNWELVIADDGSTDDTARVAMELRAAHGDRTIRYLWQPNGGLVAARNAGIRAARAGLVTFLDSDDEYAPGHLRSRLECFRNAETGGSGENGDGGSGTGEDGAEGPGALDMVHGGLTVVGGPDWVPDKFDPSRRIPIADCFVGGTFVFRRDLWQRLGGFRKPDYGDDHDFMTRALAAGARVMKCDLPTYIYHRESPDGLCNMQADGIG